MKKTLSSIFILLAITTTVNAQNWNTNFQEATAKAAKESKNIILVFSGSDWCAPCIKLEQSIFQSEAFKTFSATDYILVRADFPKRKKNKLSDSQQEQNNELAAMYNPNGYFPLVVVLNAEGKVLGKTGYKNTTPEDYISVLASFTK
ncbi:Disulfide bond reductase DsbH [Kordia antarctica]|uniref:Disulfide bond reductase DsbH n=1 Tax=Kordia antarctica TaxID=1218801 RepID=A0A7L4ZID1_9FLAO|nr:thioredoxin family protein [Kordia antarctica]QHI36251.1 Disulfide bond reductase DsbH [Kordia antarctica]